MERPLPPTTAGHRRKAASASDIKAEDHIEHRSIEWTPAKTTSSCATVKSEQQASPPQRSIPRSTTPASARSIKGKKKVLRSNFEPQHDTSLYTVINNTTGSTTRDWKPNRSPAVPNSKASEAAYKGWQNRRCQTPISSPASLSSPAPPPQPIHLPPPAPSAATNWNPWPLGPRYVPMPAGSGSLELARGGSGGDELAQTVEDGSWQALKHHYKAYIPPTDLLERAKLVVEDGAGEW